MGFTAVTPDQLEQVFTDPGSVVEVERQPVRTSDGQELECYLDKSGPGLMFLLGAAGVPVDLELYMHDMVDNEAADTCGWSVDEVREAAEHLRATPFERLAGHFDPAEMTRQAIYPRIIWERDGEKALDYLQENYEYLVRFFDAAAQSSAAALQSHG